MRLLLCALMLSWVTQPAFAQETASQPARLKVDWNTERNLWLSGSKAVYPQIAALAQIEGVVRIRMVVGTDGVPSNVQFVSGAPLLIGAALDAVKTWRFRPTLVNGVPVEVETVANVDFFLPGRDLATVIARERKKVQEHPNDPKAHEALARELLQDDQLRASIDEFRRAVALKPRDAALHFGLADVLRQSGEVQAAIAEYREGLALAPKETQAREDFARCLEQVGDPDSALSEYRTLLQQDRHDGSAHFRLGLLLMNKGDVDGAINEFRSALHNRFDTPATHYWLGTALEKMGQLSNALKEYKKASSEAPQEKSYHDATDRVEQALQQEPVRL
jgi:TonB family protein